jgi:hypothetical protein
VVSYLRKKFPLSYVEERGKKKDEVFMAPIQNG